jgi:hypothetical protein
MWPSIAATAAKKIAASRFVDITEIFKYAHSGKEVYFAIMTTLPVIHSFLDESADQQQQVGFCVGMLIVHERDLKILQDAWRNRLGRDDIQYFRASDCKAVKGPFGKLRTQYASLNLAREAAATIRAGLEDILLATPWIGIGLCVDIPEYKKGLSIIPQAARFYSEDPTIAAYAHLFYEGGRIIPESGAFDDLRSALKARLKGLPRGL